MPYEISQAGRGGLLKRGATYGHTLIVLVHSFRWRRAQWLSLLDLAGADDSFDGCDFYLFTFSVCRSKKIGLEAQGCALSDAIDIHSTNGGHKYERIILIGYSLGGLIARSAYLSARGVTGSAQARQWADCVARIILMATPNRGMGGPGTAALGRAAFFFGCLLWGKFLKDATKGSDFLTKLRLDWVSAFRDSNIRTPEVIQLLGINDEYVRVDDSNDVTIFRDAKLFTFSNTKHRYLATFRDANDEKYLRLKACCFESLTELEGDERPPVSPPSAVLFELHGIRDYGGWLDKFAETAKQIDPKIRIVRPGYGYFSALGFIMPWIRRRRIAWFCDQYTEEVAALAVVDDVPFYFIGHSYGTYLLGECLKRFPRMRFKRVCLVGSVLPQSFGWRSLIADQLEGLRNDCCSTDWPVGICCQVLSLGFRDLGVGGFRGFQVGIPEAVDHLCIPGNHSATLTDPAGRLGAVRYLLFDDRSSPALVSPVRWLDFASHWAVPLTAALLIACVWIIDTLARLVGLDSHLVLTSVIVLLFAILIYI